MWKNGRRKGIPSSGWRCLPPFSTAPGLAIASRTSMHWLSQARGESPDMYTKFPSTDFVIAD